MYRKMATLFTFMALLFLAGCQTTGSTDAVATMTVTDARGDVQVPANPQKVAVFDYGHLDTLKQLDLGSRILATVTQNAPAYISDFAGQYENVGTLKEPHMERLAELQPDLIIISNRLSDFSPELEEIAPVLLLSVDYGDYWGSTKTNIRTLAKVFDKEEQADTKIAHLEEAISVVQEGNANSTEKAMALMLDNGSLSAFGKGSRFSLLFDTLGFHPVDAAIEESAHGQSIGYEGILQINPDILFVLDRTKAIQESGAEQSDVLDNDFIKKTNAYQEERIISLRSDLWYLSGGGLESVQLMVEDVAASIAK